MTEYKLSDKITLIHGDCMKYLEKCIENKFDLAVVDPPYGINIASKRIGRSVKIGKEITKYKFKDWDIEKPDKTYFKEINKKSKNQIIFGGNYFCNNLVESRGWFVWDKKIGDNDFSMAELAFTSFNKPIKIVSIATYKNTISNNKRLAKIAARIHPTQKPIALYEWIYKNYSKPTDKIIDTHLGSGSNAIAAHRAGLEFVGIEKDDDYFEATLKRVTKEIAQGLLFR